MRIPSRRTLPAFLADDRGNATIEWTVASAAVVLLAVAVLFVIYGILPFIYDGVFGSAFTALGL